MLVISIIAILNAKEDFQSYFTSQRELLSQVCHLLQTVLVMPAARVTSKSSFSALRRAKSYLRNTMGQEKFNSLIILYII